MNMNDNTQRHPCLVRCTSKFEKCNVEVSKKFYNKHSSIHWHDYYELEVIASGKGKYRVNGNAYNLARGCAYLVTPKDFHEIEGDGLVLYNIAFNSSMISWDLLRRLEDCTNDTVALFDYDRFPDIELILGLLLDEYNKDRLIRNDALKKLLEYLLICFLRCPELQIGEPKHASIAVMQTVSFVKNNFRNDISLSEAADKVHLSPNYLGELFQDEIGVSFRQYLTHTRLAYARNLLTQSDASIEQIAVDSGFSSASYFSEVFKAQYACTPTIIRNTRYSTGPEYIKR